MDLPWTSPLSPKGSQESAEILHRQRHRFLRDQFHHLVSEVTWALYHNRWQREEKQPVWEASN